MTVDLFSPMIEKHQRHLIFRRLCGPLQAAERDVLRDWSQGFVDRDGKFVKEFQTTFESSMWELYVYACIRELGGVVNFKHARPDFVASLRGVDLCVEATVSQPPARRPGGLRPGPARDSGRSQRVQPRLHRANQQSLHREIRPLPPRVLDARPCQGKAVRYCARVLRPTPPHSLPTIVRSSPPCTVFTLTKNRAWRRRHHVSSAIRCRRFQSPIRSDLPVGFFCDDRYAHVSAVIYSPIAGMGKIRALARDPVDQLVFTTFHPNPASIEPRVRRTPKSDYTEHLLDGLYVMHNPNARHPLGIRHACARTNRPSFPLRTRRTTGNWPGRLSAGAVRVLLGHSVDGRVCPNAILFNPRNCSRPLRPTEVVGNLAIRNAGEQMRSPAREPDIFCVVTP